MTQVKAKRTPRYAVYYSPPHVELTDAVCDALGSRGVGAVIDSPHQATDHDLLNEVIPWKRAVFIRKLDAPHLVGAMRAVRRPAHVMLNTVFHDTPQAVWQALATGEEHPGADAFRKIVAEELSTMPWSRVADRDPTTITEGVNITLLVRDISIKAAATVHRWGRQ
jgi:hypothetical protein